MASSKQRTKVEDKFEGGEAHDFETGDLSGKFVGTRQITNQFGDKLIHDFETEAGPKVIFGRAMLNRLLAQVTPGSDVDVVETGRRIKTASGGLLKEYEVYTVDA
jgi:hypothetical protein